MPVEKTDTVVIGAGVIGLAVARAVALTGREVIVLEANPGIGMESSSRNSEVIHAGIHYIPGSLKARCCVRGKELLYRYCEARGIPYRRCGKLTVASDTDQAGALEAIRENAIACGVTDLETLDRAQIRRLEPAVKAAVALWSPSTGIIDSHALMLALQADLEAAGGTVVLNSRVEAGRALSSGCELEIQSGGRTALSAARVINSAGLNATDVASGIAGVPAESIPRQYYVRGHYFNHGGPVPFTHLVYPLPTVSDLGIHATLDMAGQLRFGPDAEYCDGVDYRFDDSRKHEFFTSVRNWFPGIDVEKLQPGYVGVRPKLEAPEDGQADFRISGPEEHGIPGLVNLFGIESPGLTACLALAEETAGLIQSS